MNVREIHRQITVMLPFPKNLVFAASIEILNEVAPNSLFDTRMSMSTPLASYAGLIMLVNNSLSIRQHYAFKRKLCSFCSKTFCALKDEPSKQIKLKDELHRVFGICNSFNCLQS